MGSNIEAFFETRFEAILKPPGRLLASVLGAFWARFWSPGRDQRFLPKLSPHCSGSMIFRVPGASKNAPRCLRKGLRPAAWLQEGLGRLLGSILARFWPPFWRQNGLRDRLKTTLNKVQMYTSLSIPCSTLIFTPPESMTEVMTRNVYLPKHSMLVPHFHTT